MPASPILALARPRPDDPPVRIREIAESHGIPERYLVQILLQLKGAGLVHSTRGAAGGYRLARPAEPDLAGRGPHGDRRARRAPSRVERARGAGPRGRLGAHPRRRAGGPRPDLDRRALPADRPARVGHLSRSAVRPGARRFVGSDSASPRSRSSPHHEPFRTFRLDRRPSHFRDDHPGRSRTEHPLRRHAGGPGRRRRPGRRDEGHGQGPRQPDARRARALRPRIARRRRLLAARRASSARPITSGSSPRGRLADGTLWPLPVTLPVNARRRRRGRQDPGPPRRLRQPPGLPPRRGDLSLRQGGRGQGGLRHDRRQAPGRRLPQPPARPLRRRQARGDPRPAALRLRRAPPDPEGASRALRSRSAGRRSSPSRPATRSTGPTRS